MRISNTLIKLCLDRVNELASEAREAHKDCVRFKSEKDANFKITDANVHCRQLFEKQYKWVCALLDIFD